VGFKGEALNHLLPLMGEQSSPIFRLMLLTKEKASDKVRRSGAKECWASPKGIVALCGERQGRCP